ncbi:MAG: hypothetical protein AAGG48_31915 [Planctomycetota bacterium]
MIRSGGGRRIGNGKVVRRRPHIAVVRQTESCFAMSFLNRMLRSSPTVDDPVFGRIEWSDGVWTSVPRTNRRPYTVNVVSRISGPLDAQRELFSDILSSLDQLRSTAIDYLRTNEESAATVGRMDLDLYAIILDASANVRSAEFRMELAAPTSRDAEEVFGVHMCDGIPTGWYMDH